MKKRKENRNQVKQTKAKHHQTEEVLKELNTQDQVGKFKFLLLTLQHIHRQVKTIQGKMEHLKVQEENKIALVDQLKSEALQEKAEMERKKHAALEVVGQVE